MTSVVRDSLADITAELYRQMLASGVVPHLDDEFEQSVRGRVRALAPLLTNAEVDRIVVELSQQLFGLGPLDPLLADPQVTEVMVNGPGPVWVERAGRITRDAATVDTTTLGVIIERIVGPLGLRVDRTSPFADARLADGSRVHIAVPPLAIDGPYLTIRRFSDQPFALEDFCSAAVAGLLVDAVNTRLSLIVSGGTGSGKTSLLNALASYVPATERVITIEDAAELRLPGDHVVRLEARPANAEGVGAVSIRSLVRNALRMRPDRIIVGEVRGGEALDMLHAMNTGHEGSMSTCHANSPPDALRRVESMVLMADVALPVPVVRDHIRSAVDLVVQVAREIDGGRRVSAVIALVGDETRWLVRDGECVR